MKKIFCCAILILLTFFPFNSVKAARGCCSGHGGVNCSKIQSNGGVVCNDGWTGSSCSYSSMVKCQGYSPSSLNKQTYTYGCTDKTAKNYNSKANKDDGSCIKKIYGCTNSNALNYNSKANTNDHSCKYEEAKADFSNKKSQKNILKETPEDNSIDVIIGALVVGTIGTVTYLVVKKKPKIN